MVVEGDALSIIKKAQIGDNNRSKLHSYLADINMLKKEFDSCMFLKVARKGNETTHLLAKQGIKLPVDTYLDDWWPSDVQSAHDSDLERQGLLGFEEKGF